MALPYIMMFNSKHSKRNTNQNHTKILFVRLAKLKCSTVYSVGEAMGSMILSYVLVEGSLAMDQNCVCAFSL